MNRLDFTDNIESTKLVDDMERISKEDPEFYEECMRAVMGKRIRSGEMIENLSEFERKRAIRALEKQEQEFQDFLALFP